MVFKINISTKDGKTYKLETEAEALIGKELNDKISGKDVSADLDGYELIITGLTDSSGFMAHESIEGVGLGKVLLGVGRGLHKKPKGEKKKNSRTQKGLRLRRTVRGKVISPAITQINTKVVKEGAKKLADVFKQEVPAEGKPAEEAAEEKKE